MASIRLITCLLFIAVGLSQANVFRNYRLVRISPKSQEQIDFVGQWTNNEDFDIWGTKPEHMDVLLSPKSFKIYSAQMEAKNVDFKVINNDIQDTLDEEARSIIRQKIFGVESRIVNTFARHGAINTWLDQQAAANSAWVSIYSIGRTYENRDMKVIRLKKPTTQKSIWIDCGIHAREWISPGTCVWMIDAFIKNSESDATVKSLLAYYDIHVLPVVNPDGYEYSFTSSGTRLWRKNRRPNPGSSCIGTDLNRNYGFQWMVAGASSNPCADTYAGPTPDSELETKNVEAAINALKGQWAAFFTIHTYGQYWFTPWGYTSQLPSDYSDLAGKSQVGANAIRAVFGSVFKVGSSTNLLYAAAGGSDDWAKAVAGIKYSHCLELRPGDSGADANYGFTLPVDRLPKAGEETWKGVVAFLGAIRV